MDCMVVCSRKGCNHSFAVETRLYGGKQVPVKMCPRCRSTIKKYNRSKEGKKSRAKFITKITKDGRKKKARRKYKTGVSGKAATKRYDDKNWRRRHDAKMANPGAKMMESIRIKMHKMCKGKTESATVRANTQFGSRSELRAHLESTFEGAMGWHNHGQKPGHWEIGHRIARAMYNHSNTLEVKLCWCPANIFAQWGNENRKLGVKLPDDSTLLQLKPVWPDTWQGVLPDAYARPWIEKAARKKNTKMMRSAIAANIERAMQKVTTGRVSPSLVQFPV